MNAFFLAINRDKTNFEADLAHRMLSQISRFGSGSGFLECEQNYAIGVQCINASDVSECYLVDGNHHYLFQGRIDNRAQLLSNLDLAKDNKLTNIELLTRYYQAFGDQGIDHLRGPFVFVLFDQKNNQVVAYRDAMGGRYLVYKVTDEFILCATYEMALAAHNGVDYTLNKVKAASLLSNQMESFPSSLIATVEPLNPGMKLSVSEEGLRLSRFYSFDPSTRFPSTDSNDVAKEFRRLLSQAVSRRTRGIKKIGLMLSGGLDSMPLLVLGAKEADNLIAFSWVFDEYPSLDERHYSAPMCQQFDVEQVMINCDKRWPKFDSSMDINPIIPFGIPFTEFQEETLRCAQAKGVKVMLTGIHGDLLYEYTNGVLYELLRKGELKKFLKEFKALKQSSNSFWGFIKHYFLQPISWMQTLAKMKRRNKSSPPDFLNADLASQMVERPHWLSDESAKALRPKQWQIILDGFAGEDAAYGRYLEAKYGVERRYPFRDRDLCEFILSVPSEQLYFELQKRPIVKRAFASEFTEKLLSRNTKTVFSEVIYQGVKDDHRCQEYFAQPPYWWQDFVKKCYFENKVDNNQAFDFLRWRCGYYHYWKTVCYDEVSTTLDSNNVRK